MTIDARAYTWCNLGPLSDGGSSIAEDHAQGTGVILYKGTINLDGIHRPTQGTRVELAYSNGQSWIARLPLRLRVLSCFSNPLTKKTSVSVGCDFAYYENRKEPVTLDTRDENTNISEAEWRAATPAISGSWLAGMILCILKIRYDGTIPLTNYYTRQDFDMSAGYVEELSKLCASEGYVCRINSLGKAEFIKKDPAISTGALLLETDLIDFNPVNSGELPGDAVYSKYESLKLKAPKDDDEDTEEERDKRNWEREESFGMIQKYQHNWTVYESVPTAEYEEFRNAAGQHLYEITENSTVVYNDKIIKEPGGPWLIQRYEIKAFEKSSEHSYLPYSITTTTYDYKDRAVKRVTITNTVWGEERSETWFTYRDLFGRSSQSGGGGGTSSLDSWNTFVCVYEEQEEGENGSGEPLEPLQPSYRSAEKEDDNGEIIQERTLEWKRLAPLKMQAGVKTLSFEALRATSGGTYQSLYRETNYERNKASGITKTTTRVLVPFIETPDGSETISTIRDQIQPWIGESEGGQAGLADLSDMAASLVEYGSETRIRTEREFGIQRRPKAAERTAEANKKTPEVEQEERMGWAMGSSASQTAIELTPPYAPDDRIVGGNGSYMVIPSDAATKVLAYARTENRYLLGHRNGNGIQVLPEVLPARPISVFYIRLNGCTAAFLVNGRTWNFDPSGVTMTVDALFWGAVDGTVADAWFPMPPGATSLPAPVAITTNASPKPANAINIPSGFDFKNPNLQTLFSSLPVDSAPVFARTVTPGQLVKPYNETIALAAGGGSGAIVNPQFWIAQPPGEYTAGSGSGVLATAVAAPSTSLGARWTSGTTFTAGAATGIAGGGQRWTSATTFTAGAGSDGLVRAPGANWTSATTFTAGAAEGGLVLGAGAQWTSGSTFTAGAGNDDLEQAPGATWASASVFLAGAGDDGIKQGAGAAWSSGSTFTAGAGNSGLVQGAGANWSSGSAFYAGAGGVGSGPASGATWTSGSVFLTGAIEVLSGLQIAPINFSLSIDPPTVATHGSSTSLVLIESGSQQIAIASVSLVL